MANTSGNAYCLNLLCPINNIAVSGRSSAALTRDLIQDLPLAARSPFAAVPQTYFARLYILNDVFFEGGNANTAHAKEDHLKSSYMVTAFYFHGDLDEYLDGFWRCAELEARQIWQHCVGFGAVNSAASFTAYIKNCQVDASLFFNGSNDDPLEEQLKALYLKQELSRFAVANQGLPPAQLQAQFKAFLQRVEPQNLEGPSFLPGVETV